MTEPRIGELRRPHTIHIEDRALTSITGVRDVDCFNEEEAELLTDAGELRIEGQNLHITRLDLEAGQVMLEGEILAVSYYDAPEAKAGLFGRLFK